MGVSTNGQICYGIMFDEDTEFPWDEDKYVGDIDEWWINECGFEPPFVLYNDDGTYNCEESEVDKKEKEYYKARFDFEKAHPMPIELVNYCSADYAMYIIAIPRTIMSCSRGYPFKFNPNELEVTEIEIKQLLEFCHEYCGCDMPQPEWYLSSYWG